MQWTESVTIDRPLARVRQAIADENELLQWSAWPEATGYTCRIDGDGRSIGSAIVFTDTKGTTQAARSCTRSTIAASTTGCATAVPAAGR